MAGIFGLLMSGAGVIKDQYYNLTSLLLPGNGTNGAQNNTFLDSGTANSGSGFTITRNGNTTQGTFSPFSQTGWSNYFNGSSSLTPSSGAFMNLGTGNYTIEFWIYMTTLQECIPIVAGATGGFVALINASGSVEINKFGTGTQVTTSTGVVAANAWTHIAFVRSGTGSNQTAIYINGTRSVQGTDANNWTTTTNPRVGGNISAQYVAGYLSNVRVVTSAVYSGASFTLPTTPLTAISGTTFLTCQNNRFLDNGSTAATFTTNGSPSVTPFSPFAPTSSYSAAAVGGSGYFDGSGDYLSAPSNAAFSFSTSSFTVEAWVYLTAATNNSTIASNASYSGADGDWIVRVGGAGGAAGKWEFVTFFGGTAYQAIANSAVTTNAWTHIAAVKSGNTMTIYVNGTAQTTTASNANSVGFSNQSTLIASSNGFGNFPGYISNLRIVKGTAVVPPSGGPTSPVAEVSGTSLLLNFTNGGVVDATAKNDLETVGNAQISTTQSKWGGGSISFDGTSTTGLTIPNSSLLTFGSGDWSIEFWIYRVGNSTTQGVFDQRTAAATEIRPLIYINASNQIVYYTNGADRITASLSQNTWVYVAVVKSSGVTRMYIDGTVQATTYTDTNTYLAPTNQTRIGRLIDGFPFNGYIDDFRITLGRARTTTASPTAPFPLQ